MMAFLGNYWHLLIGAGFFVFFVVSVSMMWKREGRWPPAVGYD